MTASPDTVVPDGEITVDDLETAIRGLQLLKNKIEAEPLDLDPLLEHREAYLARRERSDAVYAVIQKFRRERDEVRLL
ncbi:MAG TPA: hypothetical protein EYG39_05895 [Rhodothermales bacterium]|nr:hypothetical protein [Rhodothermales bacterium]